MRRLVVLLIIIAAALTVALAIRVHGGGVSTPSGGVDWPKYPGLQKAIDQAVSNHDCATLRFNYPNAATPDPPTRDVADGALMGYLASALTSAHCPASSQSASPPPGPSS
jgi:hypothetical protein